jgi:hypothetical protein
MPLNHEINLQGTLLTLLMTKRKEFPSTTPLSTCVQELQDDMLKEVHEKCGNDFIINKKDLKQGKLLWSIDYIWASVSKLTVGTVKDKQLVRLVTVSHETTRSQVLALIAGRLII